MNRHRRALLNARGVGITPDEYTLGWHFCPDWDDLLVGPGTLEAEACTCAAHRDMLTTPAGCALVGYVVRDDAGRYQAFHPLPYGEVAARRRRQAKFITPLQPVYGWGR